jgi:hypothetical protein
MPKEPDPALPRTDEQEQTEQIKRKQELADVIAQQRQRREAAWQAATTKMRTAWTAGRDVDRRVLIRKHEPERRWRVVSPLTGGD